jgi:hypothetical protein
MIFFISFSVTFFLSAVVAQQDGHDVFHAHHKLGLVSGINNDLAEISYYTPV